MSRNNKLLVVTHPIDFFDPNKRILDNLESFINGNPDYDVIRILSAGLGGDYLKCGDAIESDGGYLTIEQTAQIVPEYQTIVTAGGFFDLCALNTFKCLANPKFSAIDNPLKIIVPLDLFYDSEFHKEVIPFAEDAGMIFFLRTNHLYNTFNLAVRAIKKKQPQARELIFKEQDGRLGHGRFTIEGSGIVMEGLLSYRQLSGVVE